MQDKFPVQLLYYVLYNCLVESRNEVEVNRESRGENDVVSNIDNIGTTRCAMEGMPI